ncbi:MAG: endonuclease domain-containing protein [Candidatus Omnitrophica bacterium]|nr:endonuclease domain-containing protein [Candidatus Omnitrophota bacterium]
MGRGYRVRGSEGTHKVKRQYIGRCKQLRKNQTDAEGKLWRMLRNRQLDGVKFRRQYSIDKYILDLYCPEYKLAIEADGGQHYEPEGQQRDNRREKSLSRSGVKILRFSDIDILKNIEGVWEVIQQELRKRKNPPSP